jgi:hypothetical protein
MWFLGGRRSSGQESSILKCRSFKTGLRVDVSLVCGELVKAGGLAVVLWQAAIVPLSILLRSLDAGLASESIGETIPT